MSSTGAGTNTAKQATQIDIAEDGDVILVINTGSKQMKLRVFSQCMRAASKVFNAMFGDNWSEGKNLSTKKPTQIALPEDDPQAMLYICRTLHFQKTEDLPLEISPARPAKILNIAVLVNKYNLTSVFATQLSGLLALSTPKTVNGCMHLFCAARLIKFGQSESPWLFDIVAKHVGSYSAFLEKRSLAPFLDYSDLYRFEEARTVLRLELIDMLNHYYKGPDPGICASDCVMSTLRPLRGLGKEYTAVTSLQKPAAEIIQKMQNILRGLSTPQSWASSTCKCAELIQSRLLSLQAQSKENLFVGDRS